MVRKEQIQESSAQENLPLASLSNPHSSMLDPTAISKEPQPPTPKPSSLSSNSNSSPSVSLSHASVSKLSSVTPNNKVPLSSYVSQQDYQTGDLLSQRYRIEGLIGQGGMGKVYLAQDETLERPVVIKIAHSPEGLAQEDLARFRREALKMAQLKHPNIAYIFDYGIDGQIQYLVMEWIQGNTLKLELQNQGTPTAHRFYQLISQVLQGLQSAHKEGVIHRDIKPSNLMWDEQNELLKILDFGLARRVEGDTLTSTGNVQGSIQYMAPEQIKGDYQDARADVYAVGVLAYQMITGILPFSGETTVEMMFQKLGTPARSLTEYIDQHDWLNEDIAQLIDQSLAISPNDRIPSVQVFLDQLTSSFQELLSVQDFTTSNTSLSNLLFMPNHERTLQHSSYEENPWWNQNGIKLTLMVIIGLLCGFFFVESSPPSLVIETTEPAEVFIDQQSYGQTPLKVEGFFGRHRLVLKQSTGNQTFDFHRTETGQVTWTIPKLNIPKTTENRPVEIDRLPPPRLESQNVDDLTLDGKGDETDQPKSPSTSSLSSSKSKKSKSTSSTRSRNVRKKKVKNRRKIRSGRTSSKNKESNRKTTKKNPSATQSSPKPSKSRTSSKKKSFDKYKQEVPGLFD